MHTSDNFFSPRFYWPLGIVGLLFLIILTLILKANNGVFTFTADDAYVHFKQAANILKGHYGINQGEFSAPCSSILWPMFLAPFTLLPGLPWIVLFLNLGIVIATVRLQFFIIRQTFGKHSSAPDRSKKLLAGLLMISLIILTNLMPLLFSGMEYVWQIFIVHLIMLGLINENQSNHLPAYLIPGLITAPLIRYESLAIVFPAMIYLCIRGYRHNLLLAALIIFGSLSAFSAFLYIHGIGLLPTSITAKMLHQVGLGDPLQTIAMNTLKNITNLFNLPIIFLILILLPATLFSRYRARRGLAWVLITAGVLHIIFGHITFLCRHEAYLLAALTVGGIYIYIPDILRLLDKKRGILALPATGAVFFLLSLHLFIIMCFVPTMANMAYRHPYQMHRFVTEFYKYPVGVNDLGWVSYKNDRYVLDLWGANSEQSLACGIHSDSLKCIDALVKEKNVRLVMITNAWFLSVPANWIKIGDYHRGTDPAIVDKLFGAMLNQIDFYVTKECYVEEAVRALTRFHPTLPPTAYFRFALLDNQL